MGQLFGFLLLPVFDRAANVSRRIVSDRTGISGFDPSRALEKSLPHGGGFSFVRTRNLPR
jgi:hypothetical protein